MYRDLICLLIGALAVLIAEISFSTIKKLLEMRRLAKEVPFLRKRTKHLQDDVKELLEDKDQKSDYIFDLEMTLNKNDIPYPSHK